MSGIIYREESYRVLGACFEVYREKGCGFLEAVFQECLEMEFEQQRIRFIAHPNLAMTYKGRPLRQTYTPDFICEDKIILEIKSVSKLCNEHRAQVHNYLRSSGHRLGLLVNFGHHPRVEYERIAM